MIFRSLNPPPSAQTTGWFAGGTKEKPVSCVWTASESEALEIDRTFDEDIKVLKSLRLWIKNLTSWFITESLQYKLYRKWCLCLSWTSSCMHLFGCSHSMFSASLPDQLLQWSRFLLCFLWSVMIHFCPSTRMKLCFSFFTFGRCRPDDWTLTAQLTVHAANVKGHRPCFLSKCLISPFI